MCAFIPGPASCTGGDPGTTQDGIQTLRLYKWRRCRGYSTLDRARFAVIGTHPSSHDVAATLQAAGAYATVVDASASTPTATQLAGYTAVLV